MRCEDFRRSVPESTRATAAQLEHIRSCEACLLVAIESDGDYLFRSLGGEELTPSGGVENFAAEVMQAISLRTTERSVITSKALAPSWTRWAAAAALVVVGSGAFLFRSEPVPAAAPVSSVSSRPSFALISHPVIESYESPDATIVELPSDSEIQVVMVFDDTLPVDL